MNQLIMIILKMSGLFVYQTNDQNNQPLMKKFQLILLNLKSCIATSKSKTELAALELLKETYPQKPTIAEIDILQDGSLSKSFKTVLNHSYELGEFPCKHFVIDLAKLSIPYETYKNGVVQAYKQVEKTHGYDNFEETEKVLRHIYDASVEYNSKNNKKNK